MAVGIGQRCLVRVKITDVELRKARGIVATVESPQYVAHCQEVSFDEVSGLVYVAVDVNSVGTYSMWLEVRFAEEVVYTPAFVFAEVEGEATPCDAPYIVDVEVAGESVSVTPPKIDVDAVTREEFEQLSKDVAGKVDKVEGKGLSTNDFTDEYKNKVEEFTIDKELSATSDNAIANSGVVKGLAGLAEGVSNAIGQVSESFNAALEKKADTEGYYPNMSVGMSNNLVGRGDVQDAQINFRPSAGDANITDHAARIERIKGNSVVWNQLVALDSTSVGLSANHKYFTDINGEQNVRTISSTAMIEVVFGRDKIIDLTQMFGIGNEPTTVEEYYQRKPMNIEDEFAYNEGELINMKVNSLISTSDNAYDYVKGYARVMGGHTYDCSYGAAFVEKVYFSTDKDNIVAEENAMTSENGKYTFPSDGYAVPYTTDGDESEYCVCLQHTYTKPHPPYQQEVKDLSFIGEAFPEGMRSAGSAFDEIRFNPTKKVWEKVTRIGVVDLGSLSWGGSTQTAYSNAFRAKFDVSAVNGVSFSAMYQQSAFTASAWIKNTYPNTTNILNGYIGVNDPDYTDATAFKQAMQGVLLYYELATPIIEEIDLSPNFNPDYFAWDFGTEEAIASVPSAPFRADINYEPNAVDDLRWAVSEIRSLRAELAQLYSAQASETNSPE